MLSFGFINQFHTRVDIVRQASFSLFNNLRQQRVGAGECCGQSYVPHVCLLSVSSVFCGVEMELLRAGIRVTWAPVISTSVSVRCFSCFLRLEMISSESSAGRADMDQWSSCSSSQALPQITWAPESLQQPASLEIFQQTPLLNNHGKIMIHES